MYNTYCRLNTEGADYYSILADQQAKYETIPGNANFEPRLNLEGTQSIIRVFTDDAPTSGTVLETYNTSEACLAYIKANVNEWSNPEI